MTSSPVEDGRRMVEIFRRLGNENVKLTIYPGVGHDSWTQIYAVPASSTGFWNSATERFT